MDPADVQFLASDAGRARLAAAAADRQRPLHQRHRALEKASDAATARLVLLQDELRVRAAAKVPHAQVLLFEREALEQATAWPVAVERAARWRQGLDRTLVDIGAGIGLDALAAAVAGRRVIAYERDAVRAALLAANADALGVADRLEVRAQEAPARLEPASLVFVDPDRRADGARARTAEDFEPPPSAWRAWASQAEALMVKLPPSPREEDDAGTPDEPFEVVSLSGHARERRLLRGDFGPVPPRRALALPGGLAVEGRGDEPPPGPRTIEPGIWLLDPDTAVRHAGLVPAAAAQGGLGANREGRADYLVGERPVLDLPGTWLQVEAVLPADPRRVGRWLADASIGTLEIRKRGIDARAQDWRRRLRLRGQGAGWLLLTADADGRWLACVGRCEGRPGA